MARDHIRKMKRSIASAARPEACPTDGLLARDCALSLLDRSIGFGHSRLAVIRLAAAARLGAPLHEAHWTYCEAALRDCNDTTLRTLFETASAQTRGALRPPSASPAKH